MTTSGSRLTSSMYRDLRKGAPVEVDHILGDFIERGAAHGVATPLLQVTVLFSSEDRFGFQRAVESKEEFSHDGGQSDFVWFAFGAQALIKTRQDRFVASCAERSHVEAAAQGASSTEDGALAADRTTVVIQRCQASQSGRFAAIELTELGHLREQEPSRARANSANGSEFLRFNAKDLVLPD